MKAPPDLAIVIVSHNHRLVLEHCLESIRECGALDYADVTVVDNTGLDGVAELIADKFPDVRLLGNTAPSGFAANVNRGIRCAQFGKCVAIVNPDVVVRPGAFRSLLDFLDSHPEAGIVAPKLLNSNGSLQFSCRRFPAPVSLLLRMLRLDSVFARSSSIKRYLMMDACHEDSQAVNWVTGAFLVIRKSAIDQVGMLDESFWMYWEDLEYCFRMWRMGWGVYYVPNAVAIHHHQRFGVRRPFTREGRSQVIGAVRMIYKLSVHRMTASEVEMKLVREDVTAQSSRSESPFS